jgi:UDP-N-acetylglucosamine 2-epimerase (non-hydrolysing)
VKITTVLGTRPEIIRLSLIIKLLDEHAEHMLVHTGQNHDERLSELFFQELNVRRPDVFWGVSTVSFGAQISEIIARSEEYFLTQRPDRVLILGDTNSGLAAIVARRLGIPVYHMEAGNRCYDFRVPEECNRRIIDHSSSVLMPYTNRSRENLLREGFAAEDIYVTGNPIHEVMKHCAGQIAASTALTDYNVKEKQFFLVTAHRAENVDVEPRLRSLIAALTLLHGRYGFPVVCSLHPRTRSKIHKFGIGLHHAGLQFVAPLGFFDFLCLEQSAFCVLTDSGTVQEETCILGVPSVTLRGVTERPETIECGSSVLAGCDPQVVCDMVELVTQHKKTWLPPPEYLMPGVANTAVRILLSCSTSRRPEQSGKTDQIEQSFTPTIR